MKVILCGSISAADEILSVKKELESHGHEVEIPDGVKNLELRARANANDNERADDKIKHNLIRGYFKKITLHDVVVVVNPEKRGVKGYIGGNTLIEMAFGYVLEKPLYVLHELPELSYTSEILAMQPILLDGDISKIQSV